MLCAGTTYGDQLSCDSFACAMQANGGVIRRRAMRACKVLNRLLAQIDFLNGLSILRLQSVNDRVHARADLCLELWLIA